MVFTNNHQVRFVRLDQPHSQNVSPTWFGESVGHYEGDSLVVDTIGLAAKRMSLLDVFGTPHTDALHVVERFGIVDGAKTLRDRDSNRGSGRVHDAVQRSADLLQGAGDRCGGHLRRKGLCREQSLGRARRDAQGGETRLLIVCPGYAREKDCQLTFSEIVSADFGGGSATGSEIVH